MFRLLARLAPLFDGLVIFGVVTLDIGWLALGVALNCLTAGEQLKLREQDATLEWVNGGSLPSNRHRFDVG